jgi:hypothetical protein
MSAPIQPGNLNRLRANVLVPSNSALNITKAYLGIPGIRISPQNPTAEALRTMTGTAISEEPYQIVTVTAAIVKSIGLSAAYIAQLQQTATIGDITVSGDTSVLPLFTFNNAVITNWSELLFNGTQADFNIEFQGIYYINNDLWV